MPIPRRGIVPFHVPRNTDVLFPTKMSTYNPTPSITRTKADFGAENKNVLRRTFLARSLSFASFEELLMIDFLQSELIGVLGEDRVSLRAIKFFVGAKLSFRWESAFYFATLSLKNTYHGAYFLTC